MAKYVILEHFTDQGVRNMGDSVEGSKRFRARVAQMGGRVDVLLWTMGRYDVVAVVDLPDDETASAIALRAQRGGNVRGETLRAFTAEEVAGILSRAH